MTGAQFAWELTKLMVGICLILFAVIYTLARFAASVMKIEEAYNRCGAQALIHDQDGSHVAICDLDWCTSTDHVYATEDRGQPQTCKCGKSVRPRRWLTTEAL